MQVVIVTWYLQDAAFLQKFHALPLASMTDEAVLAAVGALVAEMPQSA